MTEQKWSTTKQYIFLSSVSALGVVEEKEGREGRGREGGGEKEDGERKGGERGKHSSHFELNDSKS